MNVTGNRHARVAAVAIVAILIINAGLAFGLGRLVDDRILLREGEVAQEFLTSMVAAEASAAKLFVKPAPSPELTSFSNHVRHLPGIIRANIYSPDGFIRFSTEEQLIGLKFSDNPELAESFGGRLSADFAEATSDAKPEHIAISLPVGDRLVEAYVPILDAGQRTIAVVELYKSPERVLAIIGEVTRMIWIAAGLASALLIAVFLGLLGRGRR